MMTHEMMQAMRQEQEARIAQFHAERQASCRAERQVAIHRPSAGWIRLPSLIVQALRPAFAR